MLTQKLLPNGGPVDQQMDQKTEVKKDPEKESSCCLSSFFKSSCTPAKEKTSNSKDCCEPTPQDPNVYSEGCCQPAMHHDSHPGSHYYYMTHRKRTNS